MQRCLICQTEFEISQKEVEFLQKISPKIASQIFSLPLPLACPSCRRQRRYAFRNDRNLYRRHCDRTGQTIISLHHSGKSFPVYSQEAWWSDEHDPKSYGQDFDFNRPFFEQMHELIQKVPRLSTIVVNSENSDYTAMTLQARNCYLSSRLADDEDIYYTYLAANSKDCMDSYNLTQCELCYECIDMRQCYGCFFSEQCRGSFDLWFCKDMSGCRNCFGCIGLVQKEYCFFNEQLSKADYEKRVSEWWDGSPEALDRCRHAFIEHQKKYPVRALMVFNSEQTTTSSYIFESRNIEKSFDIVSSEDGFHSTQSEYCRDIMDTDMAYKGELCYQHMSLGTSQNIFFSFCSMGGNSNIFYSIEMFNGSQNCFGCVGMKKAQYCILNKPYSKEDYEALFPRIIAHMQKTGEWGYYFPGQLSSYGYNETAAMERFPLSREEALAAGWNWYDCPPETLVAAQGEDIFQCEVSGRSFRVIPKEKQFYARLRLPFPRLHPDERHAARLQHRNAYQIREDHCRRCAKLIETDQSPEKQIWCEACYLSFLY